MCCSDNIHCCPRGFQCSPDNKRCTSGSHSILALSTASPKTVSKGLSRFVQQILKTVSKEWLSRTVEKRRQSVVMKDKVLKNVFCPGGVSKCPDGTTCCKLAAGGWGCCALPKAVCCSDGVHCCPNGYTCNIANGTCSRDDDSTPMLQKIPATKTNIKVSSIVCPDGTSECPDGNTCCKLSSGQYGCCPLPDAVCCSDGEHCCPEGYTCDTAAGTCFKGINAVPMLQKMSSSKAIVKANNIVCPDGHSQCPEGNTCCKLASGQYGCCPLPKAVCCSDGVHCCPHGYTCDTSAGTCTKGIKTVPMFLKMPSSKRIVKANSGVVCPDSHFKCPDGNTCCKLASGGWGCCPLAKAVCCRDGVHCCPNGYTCDTSAGTCNKESKAIYMLEMMPSLKQSLKGKNVICPDEESECPDGNTCCKLASGQYGCCPLPNAVCCSDGEHCCPEGYTCDVSAGTCNKGSSFIPVLQKIQAFKRNAKVGKILINKLNVLCPGEEVQCPTNQTCCKLSSGVYGCCPVPNAVCCSDGEHCCPHSYICDLSTGSCIKDRQVLLLRISVSNVKKVVCPDGQSECPEGNTCCKLSSGQYGCCPLPKAVCCSDGVHCCPHGYTCDTSAGTCNKGSVTVPTLQTVQATRKNAESVVCPDGATQCPGNDTCCKLASGGYGCCPLPKAVCCKDGNHCCPEGYTCNPSAGTCTQGRKSIPLLRKMPGLNALVKASNVVCPDGQSECPDGNTCCKLSSGQYGCCPLPNAVCCSDGVHCCPHGYTCHLSAGTCNKGIKTVPLLQKMPSSKAIVKAKNVVCPDGASECPDGNTCCKLSSGQYGCCPLPKAVCCSDGVHCCPHGYTCDTSAGTCNKGSVTVPTLQTVQATRKNAENVVCPDEATQCPGDATCCKLASGGYGCCQFPKAVCCKDGEHCCPEGYTCNPSAGTCTQGRKSIPLLRNMPGLKGLVKASNVVCPDGQSECPDDNTCCKLSSGQYGCCPLPNAVCCSDGVHCCPNGYTCDTSAGTCNKGIKNVPLLQKVPSSKAIVKANNVVCPDGAFECPNGYTCCKLSSGGWGCCPLPKAVCCSDGIHCCPNGYTCDTSAGSCNKGSMTVPMLQKVPATRKIAEGVVCPDGSTECPGGYSCCKLASGGYGCCHYENAVCCKDGEYCCPEGYTCNHSAQTCTQGRKSMPLLRKMPGFKGLVKVSNVICPDGQSECPDGNTCCKLSSGQYGCCPLPKAVCCSDGVHCCPHGYTCDTSAGTCNKGIKTVPLLQKMPSSKAIVEANNVICPGGQSECLDGNTCCKLSSGQYGCCPLPKAVCCSDGVHCCPHGYTCDTSAGTCTKGIKTVPMFLKMPSSKRIVKANSGVVCPDSHFKCPDGNTCCKLASGGWGCCPLAKAVCCRDGVHCCPNGYTCDTSAGTCNKGIKTVPLLQKMPSSKIIVEANNVVCPDGESECPDDNTCCKLSSGQYGCCPLPNAVCCSDGVHCCPNGYTCDTSAGTCNKGIKTVPLLQMPSSKAIVKSNNIMCPDGQSECPDGNTCCKLSSGQYGCCPLPKAVCCRVGVHCCPNGYTCDTSAGTCNKGIKTVPLLQKMPSSKIIVEANNVVCPDGESECPDDNTCCKLSSGQYGCCPLPNAVCCSDGVHCCPNGYTCDTSAGTCNKGIKTVPLLQMPSSKAIVKSNNIMCPDGQSECPDGNTCCKLSSGQYGCCPLPKAVCCSDGVHCCPNGYTCDTSAGTCNKGIVTVPMLQKTSALKKTAKVDMAHEHVNTVFCPDGESECPNGYTCCKDNSGQYGCCAKGFTCNSNGTCNDSSERLVQTPMVPAKSSADPAANSSASVLCPDKKYQCPGGSTCCKLHSGSYGCCPIEKAVCCSDDKHCCPEGYICDLKEGL